MRPLTESVAERYMGSWIHRARLIESKIAVGSSDQPGNQLTGMSDGREFRDAVAGPPPRATDLLGLAAIAALRVDHETAGSFLVMTLIDF